MSYRAFKRLLGETSLERKCRFMLGTATLVLVSASFWVYGHQTEHLAYDGITTAGRLLVPSILAQVHVEARERQEALSEFQKISETHWPEALSTYQYRLIKPNSLDPKYKPEGEEAAVLKRFVEDVDRQEEQRPISSQRSILYFGAIRATAKCVACHTDPTRVKEPIASLQENQLIALAGIRLPTEAIKSGVHQNRALLISAALVTAILIMAGSYLIVRYVIVKPVKHLKDVSDAIAAGELNVRSEIQTGDEFEDLSEAYNRMLRNLVSMQDRLKKVNADLDKKIDELARVNWELFESNRLKSDFLATMSHELRTPLNIILGFSEVLLDSKPPLTDKQSRWVRNIQANGNELLGRINDILAFARMEAGKMEVRTEEFTLAEVGEATLGMFKPMADKKGIELRCQVDTDMPPMRQDVGKVKQILSNLLSNAVKFTPEGGRVTLEGECDGEWAILTVSDTGVGIMPEDQERVFEKFRQAANPITREQGGTGLGLSIVRELCKMLGGEVTLQSELGRGSTFRVRLPRVLTNIPKPEVGVILDNAAVLAGRT